MMLMSASMKTADGKGTPPRSPSVDEDLQHQQGTNSGVSSTSGTPATSRNRLTEDLLIPLEATPETLARPGGLPPKSEKELQKHMKEFQEISKHIKKAIEEEAKQKAKREDAKADRDKKMSEYRKQWVDDFIPNWEKRKGTKKLAEVWWQGLPSSVRGHVWKMVIGNELRINQDIFTISMGHAKQTKLAIQSDSMKIDDELLGKEGTLLFVDFDLNNTFPSTQMFQEHGPMHEQLVNVLESYVAYRPDVGYVPGMSYLAAMLLLNVDTLDAFSCLCNMLNKPFLLSFYIRDRNEIYKYLKAFSLIIETLLPRVHKHLKEIGVAPEQYLINWIMSLYGSCLTLDIATRVWDVAFLEGEIFLFRVALALMKMHSHELENYPADLCLKLLLKFPEDLNEEDLFDNIRQFNLDPKKFTRLIQSATFKEES